MRVLAFLIAALFVTSCAEGDVDNNGPGGQTSTTGGPADCIGGVTCADPDCVDLDGDGFGTGCYLGTDCDDNDRTVAPNATEVCDSKDNNCNGRVDENDVCGGNPPPPNNTTTPPNNTNTNNPPPTNNTTPPPNSMSPDCIDTDLDGDGFGTACPAGPDCNEGDATIHDGAPELCDGKDNDCDNLTDEDFEVGMACTAGLGVCQRSGTLRCAANGSMDECSANAGTSTTEVCNNLDDDCDGVADDGLNCNTCVEDGNEPDDSSSTGTMLNVGSSISGQLCGMDADWFRLGNYSAGQTVSVTALFSDAQGDIEMEMYVGATFETASYSGTDNETIARTLSKSGAVTIRLFLAGTPPVTGNSYTIQR